MIAKLKGSEYFKNSAILIIGTGLVQIIPVLLQPILRRIYSDEDFGNFAIYYSIISVLSIAANLRYSNSIVIPKEKREAIALLSGSLMLNVVFSIVLFTLLLLFGKPIFEYFKLSSFFIDYFWVFPLGVFLISFNLTFNFWLTRMKKYQGIVINKGARRISEGIFQYSLSNIWKNGGLIIGSLIGDFINLIVFVFQFKNSEGSFKDIKKTDLKSSMKNQKEFPKYSLFPAFLDVLSVNLPIIFLSLFYSKSILGQFDGSRQLLALPLALISVSLSQVLYQKLVELINDNKPVFPIIKINFLILTGLAIIGTLIITFFGVPLCQLILGEKYLLAGKISEILIYSFAVRFIISPLSIIFVATKKLKISAIWQIIYFISMLTLYLLEGLNVLEFLYYFVLIDIAVYILYGILIYRTAKETDATAKVLI